MPVLVCEAIIYEKLLHHLRPPGGENTYGHTVSIHLKPRKCLSFYTGRSIMALFTKPERRSHPKSDSATFTLSSV